VTSGFIHTARYGTRDGRRVEGRHTKTWFTGRRTRRDTVEQGSVTCTGASDGRSGWTAYPASGRIRRVDLRERTRKTYPEEVRFVFDRLFSSREPIGEEEVMGVPCRRYAWHEKPPSAGCVRMPEHDVTSLVHAAASFPVVVKSWTSLGTGSDPVELAPGRPVPDDVFREPDGLSEIVPFRLPPGDFLVEFRYERWSDRYGWRSVTTHVFSRKGETIRYSRWGTKTDGRGKKSKLQPREEVLTPEQASMRLWGSRLATPHWPVVKKVREETLLVLKTDVLVPISDAYGGKTHWVADHPVLGTISLKRTDRQETQDSVLEVTNLVTGEGPSR
jgi:hypothetical protein